MLAPLMAIEATTIGKYLNWKLNSPIRSSTIQQAGVMYNAPQNILESNPVISAISSSDSKIHSFDPSSLTYDHHRKPTRSRPEMFLTVQKSNARRTIHTTKVKMKFVVNQEPKM